MPIGKVTIAWKLTTDIDALVPATGKVRWHLPRAILTDQALAGLAPTPWVDLAAGAGSITIPDPWDPAISPQGWAPEIEIESTAITARYGVYVPPGNASQTLQLHELTTIADPVPGNTFALINHTHADGGIGPAGLDAQDGTLKAFATTGMLTGTFGPAGDSGTWVLCPAQYRVSIAASVGDRLLWTPGFLHQSDQEAMYDIASVVDGSAARYRSSGTNAPAAAGYGGLYTAATLGRGMRPVWWTVTADDLDDGLVTLALAYRDSGAGNVMGHAAVAGDIVLVNAGQAAA